MFCIFNRSKHQASFSHVQVVHETITNKPQNFLNIFLFSNLRQIFQLDDYRSEVWNKYKQEIRNRKSSAEYREMGI